MILLDVNVVLAAHRPDHDHYATVRPWFDDLLESGDPFGVPDPVWIAFVRLSTNRRVFVVPTPTEAAFSFVDAVRAQAAYVTVPAGPDHLRIFERLCVEFGAVGDLVPDAHLAALALEQGATLVSLDRDFARFPELRWRLPGEK